MEKKVLRLKEENLLQTHQYEAQHFENEPLPETTMSVNPNNTQSGGYEADFSSDSADGIITKLAELHSSESAEKNTIHLNVLKSSNEMKQEINKCDQIVQSIIKNLTLAQALELIDKCHFYLNDIYFPYDVDLMKERLRKAFRPVTHLQTFLQQEKTYFKPLVLLTFALGKQYLGDSENDCDYLMSYSLLLVSPITKLKERHENYLLVSIFTMAGFYFRSIGRGDDSILYSNLALQFASQINLYKFDASDNVVQQELKCRILWICFGANRTLSAKMGNQFILDSSKIERPLPMFITYDSKNKPISLSSTQFIRDAFRFYIELTFIAEDICNVIYTKNYPKGLTKNLRSIIHHLIAWSSKLPEELRIKDAFTIIDKKRRRLVFSLNLNYCFCIHLSIIPILYRMDKQERAHQLQSNNIEKRVIDLISVCINSAEMTVRILQGCQKVGILADFGVMDLDYAYAAALTFFLCGKILGIQRTRTSNLLKKSLLLLKSMASKGNNAAIQRLQHLDNLMAARKIAFKNANVTAEGNSGADFQNMADPERELIIKSSLNNNLEKEPELDIEENLLQTFEDISPKDLHLWEDGYKDAQEEDHYWTRFQEYLSDK